MIEDILTYKMVLIFLFIEGRAIATIKIKILKKIIAPCFFYLFIFFCYKQGREMAEFFSSLANTLAMLWTLFFLGPLYLILATILSRVMQFLYVYSKNRTTVLYKYLGDISWIFPFNVRAKITALKKIK